MTSLHSHIWKDEKPQGLQLHELNLLESPETSILAETKLRWPLSKAMPVVMKA